MPDFRDTVRTLVATKKGTIQTFIQKDAITTAGWGTVVTPGKGKSGVTSMTHSPALAGGACLGYSALYMSKDSFADFQTAVGTPRGVASVRGIANLNYAAEHSSAFKTTQARYDSYPQMLATLGLSYHSYREGTGAGGAAISSYMKESDVGRYLVLLWMSGWRGHAVAANLRQCTVFDPNWGEAKFESTAAAADFMKSLCNLIYTNFNTQWLAQRYTRIGDELSMIA